MKKLKSAKLFRMYPEWFCVQYKCSMDTTRVFCEDRLFLTEMLMHYKTPLLKLELLLFCSPDGTKVALDQSPQYEFALRFT